VTWAAGILGLAFFLYQPTRPRPFDILDFSEFLSLLTAQNSWDDQLLALLRYYVRDQGRTNALPYVAITLKWGLFGPDVVAWQVARFVQMLMIVAGLHYLCRRLGASRAGASWGSAILVTGGSAADAWLRLTMGEPLGLMFLLGALGLAARYQEGATWSRPATAIALLLGGMLLCKETLIATVPLLIAVAVCRRADGAYEWPGWSRRDTGLIARMLVVVLLLGTIIAIVAAGARKDAFAAQYGKLSPTLGSSLITFILFLLPSRIGLEPTSVSLPANLAFLGAVGFGWCLRLRQDRAKGGARILLTGLLLVPLAGTLAYAPWPLRELFYGLPFMITPAVLLALAVTTAQQRGTPTSLVVQLSCAAIVLLSAFQAHHLSRFRTARQEVNYGLATLLTSLNGRDSGFVALQSTFAEAWRGPGPALMRYGRLIAPDGSMPTVVNIRCEDLPQVLGGTPGWASRAVISYSNTCGPLPPPRQRIVRLFRYYDPLRLSAATGGLEADIVIQRRGVPARSQKPVVKGSLNPPS
jgi:hypothetical protein